MQPGETDPHTPSEQPARQPEPALQGWMIGLFGVVAVLLLLSLLVV